MLPDAVAVTDKVTVVTVTEASLGVRLRVELTAAVGLRLCVHEKVRDHEREGDAPRVPVGLAEPDNEAAIVRVLVAVPLGLQLREGGVRVGRLVGERDVVEVSVPVKLLDAEAERVCGPVSLVLKLRLCVRDRSRESVTDVVAVVDAVALRDADSCQEQDADRDIVGADTVPDPVLLVVRVVDGEEMQLYEGEIVAVHDDAEREHEGVGPDAVRLDVCKHVAVAV